MTAPSRRQINIKMAEDLIEKLKLKAEADETTFTDLVIRACEELLGIENTKSPASISAAQLDECIAEKLAPLEERIAVLERKITRSLYSTGR